MLKVENKQITIPTYEVGKPDINPMFLNKRVYQASSGKIYPYPIIDKISNKKVNKEYDVIIIENDYIEIMIMPTLGGRIQYGYDKINDYYFFYRNEVIKPALVGLCGPWISGGVEFNWPQHHRPSTFCALEYQIVNHKDSISVWLTEIEKMSQLTSGCEIKIYENSNRVEINGTCVNSTLEPKTFLWWTNVAVHVNDEYETFFPRDVTYVADHGKREVTSYPYANTQYYNIDYPNLPLDKRNITNYQNIKVPMSYMALGSDYNFFGGYDFSKRVGTMHVANTHLVPGKKQWTWGSGKFGQAWDRHLTDENGPYIELMAGAYSDNQPDFTWISPGDTKQFKQTWYPYSNVAKALNANETIAFNIVDDKLVVHSTIDQQVDVEIIKIDNNVINHSTYLAVGQTFELNIRSDEIYSISVNQLTYVFKQSHSKQFKSAIEPKQAFDVSSTDELYNIGLHLEQYRHPTRDAKTYYEQILTIDQFDSRANTRLGYISLGEGKVKLAIKYFKKANESLTKYNPNPLDCASIFGLAVCYKYLGADERAYKYFYKASWDSKYKAISYLELAKIDLKQKSYEHAKSHINESLNANRINCEALTLQMIIAEKTSNDYNYDYLVDIMPYNYIARYYQNSNNFLSFIKNDDKTILPLIEFLNDIGEIKRACNLIINSKTRNPILRMYYNLHADEQIEVVEVDICFPHTNFERIILQRYDRKKDDCYCKFLLALILIDKKEYELAYEYLLSCASSEYQNSVFYRVLAIETYNQKNDYELALSYYRQAMDINQSDTRLIYEYDKLRKINNHNVSERLEYLTNNMNAVNDRDDLKLEYSALLCQLEYYDACLNYMENTNFRPFEGGEGQVIEVYKTAKLAIVKKYISDSKWKQALTILESMNQIPKCLGEDIIDGTPNADVNYYLAICYENIGEHARAINHYQLCANEQVITSAKLSYKPEKLQMNYYRALAFAKLGNCNLKKELISELSKIANDKLKINAEIDYFAISLPEFSIFKVDLNAISHSHAYYLLALCAAANNDEQLKLKMLAKCRAINSNKLELNLV